jgi:hypothetical protein
MELYDWTNFFIPMGVTSPVKSNACNRNVYLLRFPFKTNSKANSKVKY